MRTRAFILCCAQAKRDTNGKIQKNLPRMLLLFHDEKPTVVRQCLGAIKSVIEYHPELNEVIIKELESIDLSKYKSSMAPLIKKI